MNVIDKLNQAIGEGIVRMQKVLGSIQNEFAERRDFMIPKENFNFLVDSNSVKVLTDEKDQWNLTDHSKSQLFNRIGVPIQYADKLQSLRLYDLLRSNLEEVSQRTIKDGALIRTVGNQIKGFLSPQYKRIDASPIFETFIKTSLAAGYQPYNAYNTDYRYQLRMIQKDIFYLDGKESEAVAFGIALTTGDYGSQALNLEMFLLRLVCLNGMLGHDVFRKVHIGKRFEGIDETIQLSHETINLDEMAMVSGIKDVIKALPPRIEKLKNDILISSKKEPNTTTFNQIKKKMSKEEFNQTEWIYQNSRDVTAVPQEKSIWRLSNAISYLAKSASKEDRQIDLENMAMDLIAS